MSAAKQSAQPLDFPNCPVLLSDCQLRIGTYRLYLSPGVVAISTSRFLVKQRHLNENTIRHLNEHSVAVSTDRDR
jgi:hypothetical protein